MTAPLLDTHAWVWWMQGDERLGRRALRTLDNLAADRRPSISGISLWEVATLLARGRISLDTTFDTWLDRAASPKTVRVLPITARIAAEVARLPSDFVRDPADRLIVATSRVLGLPVLTRDAVIARSGLVRLWSPAPHEAPGWEALPRLLELKEAAPAIGPYFDKVEPWLRSPDVFDYYAKLDQQLAVLPRDSWAALVDKVRALGSPVDPEGRGWQELFDVLAEARAFGYLVGLGCENVRFIQAGAEKAPDLEARLEGRHLLCEVKSINVSERQAERSRRVSRGELVVTSTATHATEGFLAKLQATLDHARTQLAGRDPQMRARWMIYIVVRFDDALGEFQDRYFQQIDEYLRAHPCPGVELVFAPFANVFERRLTMQSAAIDVG